VYQQHTDPVSSWYNPTIVRYPVNRVSLQSACCMVIHLDVKWFQIYSDLIDPLQIHHIQINYQYVILQVHSSIAFKCISKFTQSPPPSLHNYYPNVHLQSSEITASKYIPNLAPLLPYWALISLLNHCFQVYLYVHLIPATKSHLYVYSFITSQSFSKVTPICPPNTSLSSLDHTLRVNLYIHLLAISKTTSYCAQTPPAVNPDNYV